jgi:hypothetical protein
MYIVTYSRIGNNVSFQFDDLESALQKAAQLCGVTISTMRRRYKGSSCEQVAGREIPDGVWIEC